MLRAFVSVGVPTRVCACVCRYVSGKKLKRESTRVMFCGDEETEGLMCVCEMENGREKGSSRVKTKGTTENASGDERAGEREGEKDGRS